jgi:hypothetical protein
VAVRCLVGDAIWAAAAEGGWPIALAQVAEGGACRHSPPVCSALHEKSIWGPFCFTRCKPKWQRCPRPQAAFGVVTTSDPPAADAVSTAAGAAAAVAMRAAAGATAALFELEHTDGFRS